MNPSRIIGRDDATLGGLKKRLSRGLFRLSIQKFATKKQGRISALDPARRGA